MTEKRKPFGRWLGEAVLVFGSVIAAFYFEDFREDLREREQYINILLNLRNDMHDDVYEFRVMADTAMGMQCWMCQDTTDLGYIDRYLRYKTGNRDSINLLIMKMASVINDKWRFPSPYYNEIIKYSDLIEKDSLRTDISLYNEMYLSEHTQYEVLNRQNERNIQLLARMLDYTIPEDINKLVDIKELRNTLMANYRMSQNAIRRDLWVAGELSKIVEKMDQKLANHGIDTTGLDKKWLLNKK